MRPWPALLALLAVTACTGKVNDPTAEPTGTATPGTTVSGQVCPPASQAADDGWPKDLPDVIPRPAGIKVQRSEKAQQGNVTTVRTLVPLGMEDSLKWVLRELRRNGFSLNRGDTEPTEIDAPFSRGPALSGLVRVFKMNEDCQTLWVYAIVRDTSAPYDISYTPPPSASPLPFG